MKPRNPGLVTALCIQAAISGAAGSAALAALAPPAIVATVTLVNSMLSMATATYVSLIGAEVPRI